MRGNQLFGIFSPEAVIPPHRAPGVQGGAQMRGNQLFGIFSPETLKKGDSPAPGSMRGNQLFGIFNPEKLKKNNSPTPGSRGPGRSPDAFSALKSSKR